MRVLGADVEIALARPHGIGGDCHAFQNSVGKGFQQHAVHEGARIALIAVAHDVLGVALRGPDRGPLAARGKSRSAPPAQAGPTDCLHHRFGIALVQRAPKGLEATVGKILVQVQRVEVAACLRGDALLDAEEFTHRRVAHVQCVAGNRLPRLIGEQAIQPGLPGGFQQSGYSFRPEVLTHDVFCLGRTHARVDAALLARRRHFYHGHRVAHAQAADGLHHRRRANLAHGTLQGVAHVQAARGGAARIGCDAYLGQGTVGLFAGGISVAALLGDFEEVLNGAFDIVGSEVPVAHAIYLHHGRQRAAA